MRKRAGALLLSLFFILLIMTFSSSAQSKYPYKDKNLAGFLQIFTNPVKIEYLPTGKVQTIALKIQCMVNDSISKQSIAVNFDKIEVFDLPKSYIQSFDDKNFFFILSDAKAPLEDITGFIAIKLRFKKNKFQEEIVFSLPYKILAERNTEDNTKDTTKKIENLEVLNKTSSFQEGKGSITLEIAGGTAPYKVFYAKKPQVTSQVKEGNSPIILNNLADGTYQITIADKAAQKIPMFELELKNAKENTDENKDEINPTHTTIEKTKEEKLWEKIMSLGNNPELQLGLVKNYIREFPQGKFISSARVLKAELENYFKKKDKKNTNLEVDSLQIIAYSVTPSQKGKNNGKIIIEVEGGEAPYVFELIKTGEDKSKKTTSEKPKHQFINLPAGEYLILITDESGQRQTSGKQVKEVGSNYENISLELSQEGNTIFVMAKGGKGEIRIDYRKYQSETVYSTKAKAGEKVEILGFKAGDRVEIKATDNLSEAIEIYTLPEAFAWQIYAIIGGILLIVLAILWRFRKTLAHLANSSMAEPELEKPNQNPIKAEEDLQNNIKIRLRKPKDL